MKRLLVLLLALAMVFSLIACDSQSLTTVDSEQIPAAETSKAYDVIHEILPDSEFYFLEDETALASYYAEANARKDAILNSPTTIEKSDTFIPGETYTGTAYYVSPNGNDDNDGLSPKTAWKSPEHVVWGDVQEGDAVFFERGGIYRLTENCIRLISNVTYSAYGEGSKPVLTIAQENSAQPEYWELWQEGENGEKIWRYHQALGDVGGIVLDDTTYAKRTLEWPTPDGWLAVDVLPMDPVNGLCAPEDPCTNISIKSAGEYRSVAEQLTEDLTYLSRVDLTGFSYPMDFYQDYRTGDLYLRCDAGNPGDCFNDIEIMSIQISSHGDIYGNLLDGYHADGYVLDNLSLKYYLSNALSSNLDRSKGAVIQNCTIEWGGNSLFQWESAEPTNNLCLIGDGIYCVANNVTIRNNYMRHSGNACTFENTGLPAANLGTYLVEGNLIENCGQGVRTYFIDPTFENAFDALILRDNIILDTGSGLNNACVEMPAAIDLGTDGVQFAKQFEISDNVLLGSTMAIFRISQHDLVRMNVHDNVIAQSKDGVVICEMPSAAPEISWHMMKDAIK